MFVEKTVDEIEKMSTEEMIAYKKSQHDNETEKLKEEYKKELDEATKNLVSKDEIEKITQKQDLVVKELERIGLAYKAMIEKPTKIEEHKTALIEFIEKKSKEVADKGHKGGVEQIEVNAKAIVSGVVNKAPALMTTGNVVPNVAGGFNQLFGNYIDAMIHAVPKPKNFILELVDVTTQPGTEKIWYVQRINEEGDAAFIAEGALKPLADAEYKEFSADIKEVAVRWKMTNRVMYHAPAVVSNFRQHAEELVEQKIDQQVLIGDGTGNTINGIAELASPFVVPGALAGYYASANIYDVIQAVSAYVALNNFEGNHTVVLNTVWKAQMAGIKDSEGRYVVPPFVTPNGTEISGIRVVYSNKMPADKILLGQLDRFKVVFAENMIFDEGWENDDFSKNLTSFKLEAFIGTYFPSNYAGSIIYDDIATVLTAIEVDETP